MAKSRVKRKTNKPSHQRYNAEGRRLINKLRRVAKNNGKVFLDWYKQKYGKA